MLVLGRKVGEEIRIGDDIRVIVVDIRGGRVKLGLQAPREVAIRRDETLATRIGGWDSVEVSDVPSRCEQV